jgi:acyl-CoA dehydrogenase
MNFERVPEHDKLRESVRAYFDRVLPETKIREIDRARRIPKCIWKRSAA